jgi:hypothetical protein
MESRTLPSGVLEFYESRQHRIDIVVAAGIGAIFLAVIWLRVVQEGGPPMVHVFFTLMMAVVLAFAVGNVMSTLGGAKFSFDGRAGAVFKRGKRIRDFGRLERVDVDRLPHEGGYEYKLQVVFQTGRKMEVERSPSDKDIFKKADAIGTTMGVPVTWWRSRGQEGGS